MNILVTGGAGFIGSNLVHYLLGDATEELGMSVDNVVTLDKLTYAGNPANLDLVESDPRHTLVVGDICDGPLIETLLEKHDIDVVMHLAAESHVDRSIDGPEEFIVTNVMGTFHLLDAFRKHVRKSGRADATGYGRTMAEGGSCIFLHVSTDEVFGSLSATDPAFCETTPYAPNSPYSASKAGSDHLARAYFHTYGVPVVTTNCSNNYGPYQFPEKLLPLMIRKTLRGESLPVYGDGSNIRDWLYVGDHARGLAMAMYSGTAGEIYVIGGRCEMKNLDVVHTLIETVRELAPDRNIKAAGELIRFVTDRPGHDRRYAIDPSRISRELGWEPKETFATGLRRTVQWYLDHEDWIEAIEDGSYRGERLGTFA
ncbi:MAG: dTDP-glucose 4,6-dehydratase [Verrucomicrobiota bacterium]